MDEYPERFYTRFGALLGWFTLVAGPIWAATLIAPSPSHWDAPLVLGLIALLQLLCVVCSALMVAAFPVRIGASGLRSYDIWGRYHGVAWEDIRRVDARKYLGFPFWRIETGTGRTVLITVWMRHGDQFADRVRALGGPEHPLTRALEPGSGETATPGS